MKRKIFFRIRSKGFTLVELLVAIIIVAVVSSIGIASYTNYVRDTRDTARKSALSQIKDYLDQYYSTNSKFPDCESCSSYSGERVWIPDLEQYATILPVDPMNERGSPLDGKYSFLYKSYNNGQSYDLIGLLENSNDPYRCEVILYRGGQDDNSLICNSDQYSQKPYLKRIVEISKGLSLIAQSSSNESSSYPNQQTQIPSIPATPAVPATPATPATPVASPFGISTSDLNSSLTCNISVNQNPVNENTSLVVSASIPSAPVSPPIPPRNPISPPNPPIDPSLNRSLNDSGSTNSTSLSNIIQSPLNVYIARADRNSRIEGISPNPFDTSFSLIDYEDRKYYKVNLSNLSNLRLPAGQYFIWCNVNSSNSFCSGNPLCDTPNSNLAISEYCDKARYGYTDCGDSDNVSLIVNSPQELCTVSVDRDEIFTGEGVEVRTTVQSGLASPTLFISRTDTESISNLGSASRTDSIGHKYYNLGTSGVKRFNRGELAEGTYKVWCEVPSRNYSGNPFCKDGTAGSSTCPSNLDQTGDNNYKTITVIDRAKANDPSSDIWVGVTHPHFYFDPYGSEDSFMEKQYLYTDGGARSVSDFFIRSWPYNGNNDGRVITYSKIDYDFFINWQGGSRDPFSWRRWIPWAREYVGVNNWRSSATHELWRKNPNTNVSKKDLLPARYGGPSADHNVYHFSSKEDCMADRNAGYQGYSNLIGGRNFIELPMFNDGRYKINFDFYSNSNGYHPLSRTQTETASFNLPQGSCAKRYQAMYRDDSIKIGNPGSKERLDFCNDFVPYERAYIFRENSSTRTERVGLPSDVDAGARYLSDRGAYATYRSNILCNIAPKLDLVQQRYSNVGNREILRVKQDLNANGQPVYGTFISSPTGNPIWQYKAPNNPLDATSTIGTFYAITPFNQNDVLQNTNLEKIRDYVSDTRLFSYGCENVLYYWGENKYYGNPANNILDHIKYMRNGELIYAEFVSWNGNEKEAMADNHAFWMPRCPWKENFKVNTNFDLGIHRMDTSGRQFSTLGNRNNQLSCKVSVTATGNNLSISSYPDHKVGEAQVFIAKNNSNQSRTDVSDLEQKLGIPHYRDEDGRYYFNVFGSEIQNLSPGTYQVWCGTNRIVSETGPNFTSCSNNPFCSTGNINCYNIPPCAEVNTDTRFQIPNNASLFQTITITQNRGSSVSNPVLDFFQNLLR